MRVSGRGAHHLRRTVGTAGRGSGHLCHNTIGVGVARPGAFADYICIPEANVVPIPDDIPDEIAAIFDPFGNAVHTALSFDLVAEDVLVTGAGPIGIMAAMVAQRVGARKVVITDINPGRLELARRLGRSPTPSTPPRRHCRSVMERMGMREGFDVGLEMSGRRACLPRHDRCHEQRRQGRDPRHFSPMAFEIDWNKVIFKMLHLKGIYGREIFETWYKMIALVQCGLDLEPLITHRMPAEDFESGFAVMRSGDAGKVILDWS